VCVITVATAGALEGFWVSCENVYNSYVVTAVAMIMLLRDFWLYGTIVITMCVY
jgi:hypothetical protein